MAFTSTPNPSNSLTLLLFSMFAFSAQAIWPPSYERHIKKKTTMSFTGYIPNSTYPYEPITLIPKTNICSRPDMNSPTNAAYRGARYNTAPHTFLTMGEFSNVIDDSGRRYNGTFSFIGPWNQVLAVNRIPVTTGTGDFYRTNGNVYYHRLTPTHVKIVVQLRLMLKH